MLFIFSTNKFPKLKLLLLKRIAQLNCCSNLEDSYNYKNIAKQKINHLLKTYAILGQTSVTLLICSIIIVKLIDLILLSSRNIEYVIHGLG